MLLCNDALILRGLVSALMVLPTTDGGDGSLFAPREITAVNGIVRK